MVCKNCRKCRGTGDKETPRLAVMGLSSETSSGGPMSFIFTPEKLQEIVDISAIAGVKTRLSLKYDNRKWVLCLVYKAPDFDKAKSLIIGEF